MFDNSVLMISATESGSEGTLGIVTKVSILTPPKLTSTNIAFLACKDFISCQVLKVFHFVSVCLHMLWSIIK